MGGQPCCSFLLFALHFDISQDSNTWQPHGLRYCLDFPRAQVEALMFSWPEGVNKAQEISSSSLVLGTQAQWTFAAFSKKNGYNCAENH